MRLNIIGLVSIVVIVLLGVGGFAYWSKSQSNLPDVYYVELAEDEAAKVAERNGLLREDVFTLSATLESNLAQYNYVSLSKNEFENILSDTIDDEVKLSNSEQVFSFPGKNQAMYAISEDGPSIDKYVNWAIKNDIDELYFFVNFQDSNTVYQEFVGRFDPFPELDFSPVIELFSPLEAYAHSSNMQDPNCTGGPLYLEGYTGFYYAWFGYCFQGTTVLYYITQYYDAYSCHTQDIYPHIHANIYFHNVYPDVFGVVSCMNEHNSEDPYMCAPKDTQINVFNGTSHPLWIANCGTNNNVQGCAGVPEMSGIPLTQGDGTTGNPEVNIREGKFRSWRGLIRHEIQHTYGYNHGGLGQCGSHGNAHYEKHCCKQHQYQ